MDRRTHYETLGLSSSASLEEIKKRFRELARVLHPDVADSADAVERFRRVSEAYRVLSDAERRLAYDAELKLAEFRARAHAERPAQRGGSWQASGKPAPPSPPPRRASQRTEAENLVFQARAALRRLRYRDAESLCREALRMDRRSPAPYEILGDIHRARGRMDEALAMYSYALQLDRTNAPLRMKIDKLVGRPSGPAMSASATARARRGPAHTTLSPVARKLAVARAIITGIAAALVASLMAVVALAERALAPTLLIQTWAPELILALSVSGWMSGFVLAVNRRLGLCRDELSGERSRTGRRPRIPIGVLLAGFALFSFYASAAVYLLIAAARRSVSASLVRAYAVSFLILALFTFVTPAAPFHVLFSGGTLVFLFFLTGWAAGDSFR